MADETNDGADHCGIDCPHCQAFSQSASVLGGFAEALEKLIEDGTIARIGREMAERHEKTVLEAMVGWFRAG